MKRVITIGLLVSMVTLAAASRASAEPPRWAAPLAEAETLRLAGDNTGARLKYQEAWGHARFAAVYDPTNDGSGANRGSGLPALRAILTAANNLPQDDGANIANRDFVRGLRTELNGPDNANGANSIEGGPVLSGGRNNYGLWTENQLYLVRKGQRLNVTSPARLWNLKQNTRAVTGRLDVDNLGLTDFARSTFDGSRLSVHLTISPPPGAPGGGGQGVVSGVLTLAADGNTFTGELQIQQPNGQIDVVGIRLTRAWRN